MATRYYDSFTRSGAIAPGSTEATAPSGDTPVVGTWNYDGSGAASANGSGAVLNLANGFLYLDLGFGDVDLSAKVVNYGTVAIRRDASSQRQFRARLYSESYSGTYLQTYPQWTAYYSIYAATGPTGKYCENSGFTRTQCNNSSFPQGASGSCYASDGTLTGYNASLQSVSQGGTCTQSVSYSGTSYYVAFESVAADGTVTRYGNTGSSSQPVIRLLAQAGNVSLYVDGSLVGTVADDDPTRRANGRHGIVGTAYVDTFDLSLLNTAPNQPLLRAPLSGAVVDRTLPTVFSWQFSDADATDVQSKAELLLHRVGDPAAGTVTTITGATQQYTLGAGQLLDGATYEWQVRTFDAQGVAGPWATLQQFVVATPPPAPPVLAPTSGQTIPTASFTVRWNVAEQEQFQVQRTDATGTIVYEDTGPVAQPAARQYLTQFTVNNRNEQVRVRVRNKGLWSPYTVVPVTVSYTPPPQPAVFTVPNPEAGLIAVEVAMPVPTGTQPRATYVDLFRSSRLSVVEERIATNLPPAEGGRVPFTDYTPASGVTYSYRAQTFGANGTSSSS